MSTSKIVIIDYGVGNLLSVQRAVEECGTKATTSSEQDVIAKADRVILPGVGAFANGMRSLELLGLVEVIRELAANGVPLLGICLGMQLLLDESEENGLHKGLGILPGRVVPVPAVSSDGLRLKIPHIGWNSLIANESAKWRGTILQNSISGDEFYHVHSFMCKLEVAKVCIAECLYGGNRIPAVIAQKNVFGCQFHPEKSGSAGLTILRSFLSLQL
jgi:glutamine amidotransferase